MSRIRCLLVRMDGQSVCWRQLCCLKVTPLPRCGVCRRKPRPREKKKPRCIATTGCVVLLGKQDRAGLLSALADKLDHPLALADIGQLRHQRREVLVWPDLGGSLRSHAS